MRANKAEERSGSLACIDGGVYQNTGILRHRIAKLSKDARQPFMPKNERPDCGKFPIVVRAQNDGLVVPVQVSGNRAAKSMTGKKRVWAAIAALQIPPVAFQSHKRFRAMLCYFHVSLPALIRPWLPGREPLTPEK
jgi:hypothetical protein